MAGAQNVWLGTTDGDFGTAGNWSTHVPEAGDDIIVPAAATVNIDGSSDDAIALETFTVGDGCTVTIGTVDTYLELDLADSKAAHLGGTGNAYLDISGASATYNITNAGPGPGDGEPGLNLVGGESATTVNVYLTNTSQRVGLSSREGDPASTWTTVNVYGGSVKIGPESTVVTVNVYGGEVVCNAALTTLNVYGGQATLGQAATVTTLTVKGGKCIYNSTGTAATVKVAHPGVLVCNGAARTFTNTDVYGGKTRKVLLSDPHKSITFTNALSLNQCGVDALDLGTDMNLTRAAAS